MPNITYKTLQSVRPKSTAFFIRDSKVQGFAVKVNPTGSIKYIAEIFHDGKSTRKTLGAYPILKLTEARQQAIQFIQQVRTGGLQKSSADLTLESLFRSYVKGDRLKPSTLKCYREVIFFYLQDWLKKPVASITKGMVEKRFYQIRDRGIRGGKPTYAQATKTMRILSALMNYAMADDLIEGNPVQVLKLKRIDRSIEKRTNYLTQLKARELVSICAQDAHPVSIAVNLMLHTGMKKNEALRLKWSDIEEVHGIRCISLKETKNNRIHNIPVSRAIKSILRTAKNKSPYVFSSVLNKDTYVRDERSTIRRLSRSIQYDFRCHDLRRTFATRAMEVGIDYLMVKRLLNHKSNDITAQYIQWNSRDNLLVMKDALERISY